MNPTGIHRDDRLQGKQDKKPGRKDSYPSTAVSAKPKTSSWPASQYARESPGSYVDGAPPTPPHRSDCGPVWSVRSATQPFRSQNNKERQYGWLGRAGRYSPKRPAHALEESIGTCPRCSFQPSLAAQPIDDVVSRLECSSKKRSDLGTGDLRTIHLMACKDDAALLRLRLRISRGIYCSQSKPPFWGCFDIHHRGQGNPNRRPLLFQGSNIARAFPVKIKDLFPRSNKVPTGAVSEQ